MSKNVVLVFFLALGFQSFSQIEKPKELSRNFELSTLPYYNFGKGVGITSPDSLFEFNIRFRMQNRLAYVHKDDAEVEDKIEAETRRLRLRFDGYVGDPRFRYAIQLSFSPGDTGKTIEGENEQIIRDAVIFYQPSRHWSFSFGQTKLPGNRQRVNSSGALQLTDRSINNADFNIDRDFGVQAHYLNEYQEKFSYNIRTAISTGEGRNDTKNSDTGLAYTAKVELLPLGAFKNSGSYFEGDIIREASPKLLLSAGFSHNDRASKTKGQSGTRLFEKRNLSSLFLDAMLKYNGWSFQTAYLSRAANDPMTVNPIDPTEINFVYVGSGMDYQLSYLFLNNYELSGRFSNQKMHKDIQSFAPDKNQYSLGLTKYIWEHSFKIQTEATLDQINDFNGQTKNNWYIRFQIEIGI
ncbi:MAG TPA: porin [Flavobacterium sp.]|nr:porin [Flavobacterium sp.]